VRTYRSFPEEAISNVKIIASTIHSQSISVFAAPDMMLQSSSSFEASQEICISTSVGNMVYLVEDVLEVDRRNRPVGWAAVCTR